ncbi:MAG: hypothetical protein WAK17_19095 [Candidatus Nitrosopolaris sp.]
MQSLLSMSNGTADSAIYPLALAGSTKITMTAISISAVFLEVEIPLLLHMYHEDYVAYIALLAYYNLIL